MNKSFSLSADVLLLASRTFYERTRLKLVVSLLLASSAMMVLGFCTSTGGNSASIYQEKELLSSGTDDKTLNAYDSLVSGLGFASFAYICAFVVFALAAIYVSPLCCCSSGNEWKMAKGPVEVYKLDGLDEADTLMGGEGGRSSNKNGNMSQEV